MGMFWRLGSLDEMRPVAYDVDLVYDRDVDTVTVRDMRGVPGQVDVYLIETDPIWP